MFPWEQYMRIWGQSYGQSGGVREGPSAVVLKQHPPRHLINCPPLWGMLNQDGKRKFQRTTERRRS